MTLKQQLMEIERRLWTNDPAFYRDNLTDDAALVFKETGVITRELAVAAIVKENEEGRRWGEVQFDEVRIRHLTTEVALLTYKVVARWEHEESAISAYASSVYVDRNGEWKLAFHQQTPFDQGGETK